jgi:hypothetical protein
LEILRPNYYSIRSQYRFDREVTGIYRIELRANDYGQPSLQRSMIFQLNITDINDQKPRFTNNYTFDIIENNQIPSVIGQIIAHDADQGVNSQIIYSLNSHEFFISPTNGIISTNISFDYEYQRQYYIEVRARDYGQPPLESFAYVQVNIINQNEYAPEFEQTVYSFSLNENSSNLTQQCLGKVQAFDRDHDDHIEYQLNDHHDLFNIDSAGYICTENIFDREMQDEYNLTVIARDNSSVGSIGSTLVRILIR